MIDLVQMTHSDMTEDHYNAMYLYFRDTKVFDNCLPKLSKPEILECVKSLFY